MTDTVGNNYYVVSCPKCGKELVRVSSCSDLEIRCERCKLRLNMVTSRIKNEIQIKMKIK